MPSRWLILFSLYHSYQVVFATQKGELHLKPYIVESVVEGALSWYNNYRWWLLLMIIDKTRRRRIEKEGGIYGEFP